MTSIPGSDEWPGARKFKDKPIANMDLMEKVFGTVYISGGEGWSAQQGEEVGIKMGCYGAHVWVCNFVSLFFLFTSSMGL
ncbi:unnamed protein product [Brassica napus]|uniref:(rape) hypothetical protein n=1 Tax=Brassica napus TaxID=3708 RepID=A0A816K872_BRANA|nr:unnamed protein product [Brassica napus]